jgi:hypothetical protein
MKTEKKNKKLFRKKYKKKENCPELTPEFIKKAKDEYFTKGGIITKLDSPENGNKNIQDESAEEWLEWF